MKQSAFVSTLFGFTLGLASLTGCGFQPVYGSFNETEGAIQVLEIEGRTGHRLRQELARYLSSGLPGVEAGSFININLVESLQRLSLKADAGVSRTTLVGTAVYVLRNTSGEILLQGSVQAQTDYDVADSDYGDIALQTDAKERVAYLLASKLHQQLILDTTTARQDEQMKAEAAKTTNQAQSSDSDLEVLP